MKLSAAQFLSQIATYLHWNISGTHSRFKHLADVNPMANPKIKNIMLIENTQTINNSKQISKSKIILSYNASDMQRLRIGRTKI